MVCSIIVAVASLVSISALVGAAFDISYGDDGDLTKFVSRPEIKAQILEVLNYHPNDISPGYFFVAPYASIYQENPARSYYEPCQTGSHIYDREGNLVWSGACEGHNHNIADFRPVSIRNSHHLSAIHLDLREDTIEYSSGNRTGYGFILNSSYELVGQISLPKDVPSFNMCEFKVVKGGETALYILEKVEYREVSQHPRLNRDAGWVRNMGFQEVNISSGEIFFDWWALDHLTVADSTVEVIDIEGPPPAAWNFFDANSVDKISTGDYLVSARYMDCIYSISGKDGSIQWILGGKSSSFKQNKFSFSRQHDARFVDPQDLPFSAMEEIQYISLLDNAVDETELNEQSSPMSSVLIVALDLIRMEANVVLRVKRPDGGATTFGGNSHFLPNGNLLASWAGGAYISEHSSENKLLMEARFLSDRFTTYRSYKADFTAVPKEKPALRCFAFGTSVAKATSICYVSWNGATEVQRWRFRSASTAAAGDVLGVVSKSGFETRLQFHAFVSDVYVEALSSQGETLGTSLAVTVEKAKDWSKSGSHAEL